MTITWFVQNARSFQAQGKKLEKLEMNSAEILELTGVGDADSVKVCGIQVHRNEIVANGEAWPWFA